MIPICVDEQRIKIYVDGPTSIDVDMGLHKEVLLCEEGGLLGLLHIELAG